MDANLNQPPTDPTTWPTEPPLAIPESAGWWWVSDPMRHAAPVPARVVISRGECWVQKFGWEYDLRADNTGMRWGGRLTP